MTKAAPPKFSHAELYHKYAEKYDVYKESIKRLVSYVKDYLNDPKVIYDVAAGTGMTSSFLLSVFPNTKIIAIDKSPEMIGFMKSYINNNNVEFLNTAIENIKEAGLPSPDIIFCNAGFWYFDRKMALNVFDEISRSGSVFAFNMSEPSIDFKDGKYDDRFLQTMVEVLDDKAVIGLSVLGHDKEDITIELHEDVIYVKSVEKDLTNIQKQLISKINERITVGANFDGEKAEAKIINGVLYLNIPKKEEAKPKKLQIKVG